MSDFLWQCTNTLSKKKVQWGKSKNIPHRGFAGASRPTTIDSKQRVWLPIYWVFGNISPASKSRKFDLLEQQSSIGDQGYKDPKKHTCPSACKLLEWTAKLQRPQEMCLSARNSPELTMAERTGCLISVYGHIICEMNKNKYKQKRIKTYLGCAVPKNSWMRVY